MFSNLCPSRCLQKSTQDMHSCNKGNILFHVASVTSGRRPDCALDGLLSFWIIGSCTEAQRGGICTTPWQVFLGASAVNSNGTVVSRIGSAAVAMMADAAGVPVIICCETYKFSNKVCPITASL